MFPSCNNDNYYNYSGIDPISYNDQQAPNRQIFNDIISSTNPKQDDFPLSLFYLPSPLLHPYEFELDDHGFVLQQDHDLFLHQPLSVANTGISETILNMVEYNKQEVMIEELTKVSTKKLQSTNQHIPIRRRSSKRDRHSKINTAQGPRDRRMRLSLKVAKEFFGVQDKLGFDKASKTVEWLLIQAKPAIEKLFSNLPQKTNWSCRTASSTSECEVVSGLNEAALKHINISKDKPSPCGKKERKTTRSSHKTMVQHLARESRVKARARARERTLEKMWSRKLDETKVFDKETNRELSQLGSWIASEPGKGTDTQSHNMNHPSNLEVISEVNVPFSHKQGGIGITEDLTADSLANIGKWSPSSIFSHMQSIGVSQELQLPDFQVLYKPW